MRLIAVSDLHIRGPEDPLYAALLRLIGERTYPNDLLVLGGDVFDLLVGPKQVFVERYRAFSEVLGAACARGVSVHYIEGNHDFQLEGFFPPAVKLHQNWFEAELGERRFYFAHGDLVDRTDIGYRMLRAVFRSPPLRAFVAAAPGKWIDSIGQWSARRSRAIRPEIPAHAPEGELTRLRNIFRSFAAERVAEGYDFVLLGHCHDLDEMQFTVGGRSGHYMNLGYPRVHGSYVSWTVGDERLRREALP